MNDTAKTGTGLLLLAVGSVAMLVVLTGAGPSLPPVVGAVAMVALAGGALLVGTSGITDRPV